MRPFRSFLLLLIFLICFAGLSFLFPDELNLPSPDTLIPSEIINSFFNNDSLEKKNQESDSRVAFNKVLEDTLNENAAYSLNSSGNFKSSFGNDAGPFQRFLDSLRYEKEQIRVLYYGDSQIEGDRITSYLRAALRKEYGGTGPGLFLPVMPVSYTRSVYVRASSNWKRYNYLSFKEGTISHNNLGPLMAFCRYMPENGVSMSIVKAWIRIVPSRLADSTAAQYETIKILYRNPQDAVKISIKTDDSQEFSETLPVNEELHVFKCPLHDSRNVLIEFSGRVSPDIFAISIEGNSGVMVDNIPQRGSAGLEFTMVDRENLMDSFGFLSPDLVILQYGLNIVRNVRESYEYYEQGLNRQLSLLKEISPEAKFLVIGLTDMAVQDGDKVISYPNIPHIINAQEKASSCSGAIFWNAHQAMGGESSIIRWSGLDPPLAKKDFVHFTDQGADTLASMIVTDLFSRSTRGSFFMPEENTNPENKPLTRQIYADKANIFNRILSMVFSYNPDKPFIFTSPAFWIFLLFVLAGFSLIYNRLFIRNLYLFLVSLFFYYKTGGLFLILLILVTVIDFTCGLLIYKARTRLQRRIFILFSIISNLGILAYFKYTGFFIGALNDILGTRIEVSDFLASISNNLLGTHFNISNIILPVGISFFTFQSLSYTFDVYRRKLEPVRNIIDFGFYVSFFPQLVAGPIVRATEFIPQLYSKFNLSRRELGHALFLISKGLIKKIIISDFIAVNFVDRVFELPTSFSGLENLMGVYGYGLQIYCDFSGYTDIAIGLALIMGFRLPLNFNSPYKAVGISDFWKRWHISLSRWLKDYLYIPLGGNRKGRFRTLLNLMITMLLGGLWHGANLKFIIWGGLHGAGLVIDKIWIYLFGSHDRKKAWIRTLIIFLTFQFVSFCWILFRAPDMHSVVLMLRQITGNFLPAPDYGIIAAYGTVFLLILTGYLIHFLPERVKESYRGFFIRIPLPAQMAVIMMVAIVLFQMRSTEILPFIYFRF